MKLSNIIIGCIGAMLLLAYGCETNSSSSGYQVQRPTQPVPTVSTPVQKQWKGIWTFEDSTTFFSNNFEGARLNGVVNDSIDKYTILISSENIPINPSPWYAFTVWSNNPRKITINFTYQDSRSRYYPKVSRDGVNFKPLDSVDFQPVNPGEGDHGIDAVPEGISIKINVDENPVWISAQELYTSSRIRQWVDELGQSDFVDVGSVGYSREGRPMQMMSIGNALAKKALMIISRQHPPEVTGFLTMKSFTETICGDTELAKRFREQFVTFAVPLMNPDGVDNGHWRHNQGGIDLNRDWQNFNQPETSNIKHFLEQKTGEGYDFVFGGDFHSTWDDIYYPLDSTITGTEGMIIFDWIERITKKLPQKSTNIRPSKNIETTMVSRNYFYLNHDMPAIIFELGDNTPRDFLEEKGKVAAEELMLLLLNQKPKNK